MLWSYFHVQWVSRRPDIIKISCSLLTSKGITTSVTVQLCALHRHYKGFAVFILLPFALYACQYQCTQEPVQCCFNAGNFRTVQAKAPTLLLMYIRLCYSSSNILAYSNIALYSVLGMHAHVLQRCHFVVHELWIHSWHWSILFMF